MTGHVDVWQAVLDRPDEALERLNESLSVDERARADRFRFELDRRRFVAGRGVLRAILSGYLAVPPATLRFEYSAHGKPRLAAPFASEALRFNVSHSRGLALVAVTNGREVGIDVEYVHPILEADRIAESLFAPGEWAELRSLPPPQRLEAFFICWTLKEAHVKARGEGLSVQLDAFEVSPWLRRALRLPEHRGSVVGLEADWWLRAFSPRRGFQAALALEGNADPLRFCTSSWL
jgi:4'-phosphopantetheinyl transferase